MIELLDVSGDASRLVTVRLTADTAVVDDGWVRVAAPRDVTEAEAGARQAGAGA